MTSTLAPIYGEAWRLRKITYKQGHPRVCVSCNGFGDDLHHLNYRHLKNGEVGHEPDSVLRWTCQRCHDRIHWWHRRFCSWDPHPYYVLGLVTRLYCRRPSWELVGWLLTALTFAVAWLVVTFGVLVVAPLVLVAPVVAVVRRK